MAYDPLKSVFRRDYPDVKRTNFSRSHKVRFSADMGYLIPTLVQEVGANNYFKADASVVVSTNPMLTPLLGSLRVRMEIYYCEKAMYCNPLRNNNKLAVDRNVPFPFFTELHAGQNLYVHPGSLLEYLNMYPAYFTSEAWSSENPFPVLNAIPFVMYHDIFRNYYLNPQESTFPIRKGLNHFRDDLSTHDHWTTRGNLDTFIETCRNTNTNVLQMYRRYLTENVNSKYPFSDYRESPLVVIPEGAQSYFTGEHCGLLRRTYLNDWFNAHISNENSDLITQNSQINASVTGSSVSDLAVTFDVQQILVGNRNRRFAVRSTLWGTDWVDYNRIHYATKVKSQYGKPQFLGSMSTTLAFRDVINQSQSGTPIDNSVASNANLGSRASLGFASMTNQTKDRKKYRPFCEFRTDEEGYVMALLSIVPEVDYYQGIDPLYRKTNLKHSYSPEFDALGLQDFEKIWADALGYNVDTVLEAVSTGVNIAISANNFDTYNESLWKTPAWSELMTSYNRLHGEMVNTNSYRTWVLARDWRQTGYSTYVLPEAFQYMFANTIGYDNFQVQVGWDILVKQIMSKQVLAYL